MSCSNPRKKTASVSTVGMAQGTHSFKITRYSLHKQLSVDKCFCSAIFTVGHRDWRIRCCYDHGRFNDGSHSVFLELMTADFIDEDVRAIYEFRVVNPVTRLSMLESSYSPKVFNSANPIQGFTAFIMNSEVHEYVQDDCLLIECDVTVIKDFQVKDTADESPNDFDIQVPPSDLPHDLARLLESEEEADVTFKVGGEVFRAHKIVLAMRSPVFKAGLYGPMKRDDKGTESSITVEGMDPSIFRALLHFIYTDSFPVMDDLGDEEHQDMVKHLLVATDRYGMERMKLICESILCKSLDVRSVAYTLALAGQHHCSKLKNACIEYIISSDGLDTVLASDGYEHLKRACPDVAVELWEKTAKSRMAPSSSTKSTYKSAALVG